jgi:hypothetical protein
MFAILLGALVATAAPTVTPPKPVIAAPARKAAAPDMAALFKMFDTFFPSQPAPDPLRMPLAHATALVLLPPDSLGLAVGDMMGGMVERVLNLPDSELTAGMTGAPPLNPAAGNRTLHDSLVANDPHFDERMRLTRAAAEVEFKRYAAILAPRLRAGVARADARRFDQRQLTEINAFFATDSGRALGRNFLGLWFDPDLTRSVVAGMPDMIQLMPGSMQRITAATAHLPKPPKRAAPSPRAKPKPARG